ncbi:hypothetical protein MuYL_2854 [Mucilaginibacter xinganensis]|uniref:Uncharacterized protein n=1 Tax=Mucilaginibacter xinganensis TaxID=1234841 RepID=A0A223NYU3_9SPHI|nr:hypothetical protein MuYL_2854 [Mucilaginibacter xinganensis]
MVLSGVVLSDTIKGVLVIVQVIPAHKFAEVINDNTQTGFCLNISAINLKEV